MGDVVFNIAKGRVAQIVDDAGPTLLVLLLEAAEADADLVDHDTVEALLNAAGNTELSGGTYARKTGITGTVTVDDTADDVEVDIPDQTWTALTSGSSNPTVKAVIAWEDTASDAGRVPLVALDWAISPDGSNVTLRMP